MTRDAKAAVAPAAKRRRDTALHSLMQTVPYIGFMGIRFDRRGDELTAVLPFDAALIGNPLLPALHGGATAGFLEVAAVVELAWQGLCEDLEHGQIALAVPDADWVPQLPRTISFTVDYLRPGLARDAYARARVNRSGRRYASVHVEAWQDNRARPFALATGQFVMPEAAGSDG